MFFVCKWWFPQTYLKKKKKHRCLKYIHIAIIFLFSTKQPLILRGIKFLGAPLEHHSGSKQTYHGLARTRPNVIVDADGRSVCPYYRKSWHEILWAPEIRRVKWRLDDLNRPFSQHWNTLNFQLFFSIRFSLSVRFQSSTDGRRRIPYSRSWALHVPKWERRSLRSPEVYDLVISHSLIVLDNWPDKKHKKKRKKKGRKERKRTFCNCYSDFGRADMETTPIQQQHPLLTDDTEARNGKSQKPKRVASLDIFRGLTVAVSSLSL